MFKHILVPTDGSEISKKTCKRAISFAKEAQARLTFVHVVHESAFDDFSGDLVAFTAPEKIRQALKNQSKEYLREAESACHTAGVACKTLSVNSQKPYQAIIETAEDEGCDLIFMASHGRQGVGALLLGSETQKVLTHSTIPVLVYRCTPTSENPLP